MSIDLTRPLIHAMGQHDPLDGFVALSEVREAGGRDLTQALDGLAGMGRGADWATADPLGAGALLINALILSRLARGDGPERRQILSRVLHAASRSLREVERSRGLELPAGGRLPFRELGLAIGLTAVMHLPDDPAAVVDPDALDALRAAGPGAREIIDFWRQKENQRGPAWVEHDHINTVMLATALAPDAYLGLD
jgi:hypothetical protein